MQNTKIKKYKIIFNSFSRFLAIITLLFFLIVASFLMVIPGAILFGFFTFCIIVSLLVSFTYEKINSDRLKPLLINLLAMSLVIFLQIITYNDPISYYIGILWPSWPLLWLLLIFLWTVYIISPEIKILFPGIISKIINWLNNRIFYILGLFFVFQITFAFIEIIGSDVRSEFFIYTPIWKIVLFKAYYYLRDPMSWWYDFMDSDLIYYAAIILWFVAIIVNRSKRLDVLASTAD